MNISNKSLVDILKENRNLVIKTVLSLITQPEVYRCLTYEVPYNDQAPYHWQAVLQTKTSLAVQSLNK